jgi:hypothetical protein
MCHSVGGVLIIGGGYVCVRTGNIWEFFVPSSQFFYEPTTDQKSFKKCDNSIKTKRAAVKKSYVHT